MTRTAVVPLRFVVAVLVAVAAWALIPLWAPVVFAIWTAVLCRPLEHRLSRKLGGAKRGAGAVTALVIVAILVPLVVLTVSLGAALVDAQAKFHDSQRASDLVRQFLPGDAGVSLTHLNPSRLLDFARNHAKEAATALQMGFGAAGAAAVGLVIYVYATYECLLNGLRAHAWLARHSLLSSKAFARLTDAFTEAGRGLIIGIGGTALLQGAVATIGYVVVGAPVPLLLGFVTTLAALIPSVGTALVWVPVTIALFVTERTTAAIVLGIIGCLTSVVDNFVRPWLSKFGELAQPSIVTFVAMLGGVVAFGGFGIVLGPLFTRLAIEGLELWREARPRAAGSEPSTSTEP